MKLDAALSASTTEPKGAKHTFGLTIALNGTVPAVLAIDDDWEPVMATCTTCGSTDPAKPGYCSNGFHGPKPVMREERRFLECKPGMCNVPHGYRRSTDRERRRTMPQEAIWGGKRFYDSPDRRSGKERRDRETRRTGCDHDDWCDGRRSGTDRREKP